VSQNGKLSGVGSFWSRLFGVFLVEQAAPQGPSEADEPKGKRKRCPLESLTGEQRRRIKDADAQLQAHIRILREGDRTAHATYTAAIRKQARDEVLEDNMIGGVRCRVL